MTEDSKTLPLRGNGEDKTQRNRHFSSVEMDRTKHNNKYKNKIKTLTRAMDRTKQQNTFLV